MATQIHVMNLEVDLLTEEELEKALSEYLSNDFLNVVHLISMDYIDGNDKSEIVDSVLAEADLILPGEKAILSKHHVDVLEAGEMVVDYKNFINIMSNFNLKEKKCYFIMRTKNEAKSFYRMLATFKLDCECAGIYTADSNVTDEALINDINTQVPDLIYLALDQEVQEKWILEHKAKLNAKLCICLGSILPMIHKENPNIPGWVRFLHLDNPYKKCIQIPTSNFFRQRIFRKKMANYNNKSPKS